MILKGVGQAMLARAIRAETLMSYDPAPVRALESVARSLWEHEAAMLRNDDGQEDWDSLEPAAKEAHLRNAAWILGRLVHDGFRIERTRWRRVA